MLKKPLFALWLGIAVALAAPSILLAQSQSTTGIIRGSVTDPVGDPIAGAAVEFTETSTNFARSVRTQDNGVFAASLLPLGNYDIRVRAIGYQESHQTGLRLRVGQTLNLDFTLGTAVALEAIVVEAAELVIDVSRSESATRLPEEATRGLPNNGRDFINLTTLTPNVAIVQGPDGDELTIAGQRGINNNISVDGADFNNPFFGEQRGGQRPPFTFNLDAVQEIVVISQGANAEFGRSSGGFVNVITKSGTNELHGSLHYFGKFDEISAEPEHTCSEVGGGCGSVDQVLSRNPDFQQHQFGFTLGGPIVRDRSFFFIALDVQDSRDTRQADRAALIDPALAAWVDTAFGGALRGDDGPIARTDNARALLVKFDFRLGDRHSLSLKYNYSWSQQENGTFDVDTWLLSANGLEKDFSHAGNGILASVLSSGVTNEFRFQYAREDRPRPYVGPTIPGVAAPQAIIANDGSVDGNRPFPDIAMQFGSGFRLGMPFFLPVVAHDTRVQLVDNVTISAGDHLVKIGAEYNRVETVQTFIGFGNGRFVFSSTQGFLNYAAFGNSYVECSDGTSSTTGACPAGTTITGPVLLYLQQAGVPPFSLFDAGTQAIPQTEIAFFIQDSWKPHPNLTLNYGVRWEASLQPEVQTPPSDVFFQPFIGTSVTTAAGTFEFPSDGTIPDDWDNFQPRFGFAWDAKGDNRTVVRGSLGWYFARIASLNFASTRSTNGSIGQTLFRNSALTFLGLPPDIDDLLVPVGSPFFPDVFVTASDFENPRTIAATFGIEHEVSPGIAASVSYTHSRTDGLTRFVNRNDPVFGSPWAAGLAPGGANGIASLNTLESSARSRYNGVTFGLNKMTGPVMFQLNYTLSSDKSDDDNERDPFSFRYARPDRLDADYNWSDRDQRHRFNAWMLALLPADISINSRLSAATAQPVSASCGASPFSAFAPPAGQRIAAMVDRNCADGTVLTRNTLRKDNAFVQLDIRFSKLFRGRGNTAVELIVDIFNVTNADNFLDPTFGELLFNFDGTVQSGLGTPRSVQVGARVIF